MSTQLLFCTQYFSSLEPFLKKNTKRQFNFMYAHWHKVWMLFFKWFCIVQVTKVCFMPSDHGKGSSWHGIMPCLQCWYVWSVHEITMGSSKAQKDCQRAWHALQLEVETLGRMWVFSAAPLACILMASCSFPQGLLTQSTMALPPILLIELVQHMS